MTLQPEASALARGRRHLALQASGWWTGRIEAPGQGAEAGGRPAPPRRVQLPCHGRAGGHLHPNLSPQMGVSGQSWTPAQLAWASWPQRPLRGIGHGQRGSLPRGWALGTQMFWPQRGEGLHLGGLVRWGYQSGVLGIPVPDSAPGTRAGH